MSKKPKHISSAGNEIDFDLVRAKQQIAAQPTPSNVQDRQDRINARLRRRMNALGPPRKKEIVEEVPAPEQPNVDVLATDVEEGHVEEQKPIEKKPRRRQKAKPLNNQLREDDEPK